MERLARVTLAAPGDRLEALRDFYAGTLGLPVVAGETCAVYAGPDVLAFEPGGGAPFYHFALLVGDFDAARERVGALVDLLPHRDTGEVVFDFPFWDAHACYFHDPAGNVVELIAHGVGGDGLQDAVLGISEIGVVAEDPHAAVADWEARGAPLWSGGLDADGHGLAFCGTKAHTVIVSGVGRGWLPTGRPAEAHPVDVVLG